MKILCPGCFERIPEDDLNIGKDLAYCRKCDEAFSVSELLRTTSKQDDDELLTPPKGAWFQETVYGFTVGATTRSPVAFFMVPFMLVWSGGSLGGIYGTQIASGEFNPLLSLFGIPFLLGSILFWSLTLLYIWGKVEVVVGSESYVFVGVGTIGWKRRFDWDEIESIRESSASGFSSNRYSAIYLEGQTRIKFGQYLSNESRKFFLIDTLRKKLNSRR